MPTVRAITLRLSEDDPEECAILNAYDASTNYRKQDMLRMLLKTGYRAHGGQVPRKIPATMAFFDTLKQRDTFVLKDSGQVDSAATDKNKQASVLTEHIEEVVIDMIKADTKLAEKSITSNDGKSLGMLGMFGNQSI